MTTYCNAECTDNLLTIFQTWHDQCSHLPAKIRNSKSPRHWLFHKLVELFHFIRS